jgi:hypothetical protein
MRGRPSRRELAERNDWLVKRNALLAEQLQAAEAAAAQWQRRSLRLADDFERRGRQDAEEMAHLAKQIDDLKRLTDAV